MRRFEEIAMFVLAAFIDIATSTPTVPIKYTLYGTTKPWNEARAVCEANGQQMLKLDTEAKFDNFISWKNIWEANGHLTEDIWTGLHQRVLTDPTVFNLEWHDCEPFGAWAPWDKKEPNLPDTEKCVRIHLANNKARTYPCSSNRQVVCQEFTEECTFERFDDQDVAALTSASSINVSIDDCQRTCLNYTGLVQCVAVVYDNETTSGDPCRIYDRQQVYVNDNPEMTSSSGITVLVKRCIQGDYISAAVSVPTNKDNEPITTCFETTSSTSMKSSEPITASPTYPGTTKDIQLSVLTSTQSVGIHSSYVSFSNGGPVDESVFTSEYIVPEENALMSIAISMTSSSIKSSFFETESIEAHLASTITSRAFSPISLNSSSSFAGFGNSSSHNLHFSIDHLTSSNDSTTSKTASASNVVTSETSAMTMSQITTLPSPTIVSDPESSTQVSRLDLDPSSVALSTVDVSGYLLDRKNLSSYRRSKISASDDRVSARAIGSSGLAIILLVTAVIVCGDVDRMIRAMGRWRKRQTLSMCSSKRR
ncbi:uncharacterized protein [Haliotis asinina]|uniref:uncharacterized protein n=1 Tax=Haliotis asinina TaxID=109174 RepID=UPI003531A431